MRAAGIPRIYVLEDDYRRAQAIAEHGWLTRTIGELRSNGSLGDVTHVDDGFAPHPPHRSKHHSWPSA